MLLISRNSTEITESEQRVFNRLPHYEFTVSGLYYSDNALYRHYSLSYFRRVLNSLHKKGKLRKIAEKDKLIVYSII